jgi:hypothetical protein
MTTPAIPRFVSENNLDLDTIKINDENNIFTDASALVDATTVVINEDGKISSGFSVGDVIEEGHVIATLKTGAEDIEIRESVTEFEAEFDPETGKLKLTHTNEDGPQPPLELDLTAVTVDNALTEGEKILDITINGELTEVFVPVATDTVPGVVTLAVASEFPSTTGLEVVTVEYLALLVEELTKDVFDA